MLTRLLSSRGRVDPARRAAFLAAHPEYPLELDRIRAREYPHLDAEGRVYLDYTGSGLPARRQLTAAAGRLLGGVYGNPHTESPASAVSTELVNAARARVLRHLNAAPEEYAVVFTQNATGACRLVGEAYAFEPDSRLVLTFDNHNSVNGLREFARSGGATVEYVPLRPDLRLDRVALEEALAMDRPGRRLFAYPAQSNFSGVRHPLELVELAQARGYEVLLDAAAYLPTNSLDLSAHRPEYVPVSFYKMFGYPTGVGALVVRRDALRRLARPWFSGGTIWGVSVRGDWHRLAGDETAFEDGTLNFLAIPDVSVGLDWLAEVGVDRVRERVRCLAEWLVRGLTGLTHSDGRPLAEVYGPLAGADRGATVVFNLLDPAGRWVDERAVARDASRAGISVRTGCFCNPGAAEVAFELGADELDSEMFHRRPYTLEEYLKLVGMDTGGAVRVSLGLPSDLGDVEALLRFAAGYRDRFTDLTGLVPRERC